MALGKIFLFRKKLHQSKLESLYITGTWRFINFWNTLLPDYKEAITDTGKCKTHWILDNMI